MSRRKYDPRWDQDREKTRSIVLDGIKPATANLTAADMVAGPLPDDRARQAGDLALQALINVFSKQMSALGQIDCKSFGDPESYLREIMRQFGPRDYLEEVMLAQVIVTHARLLHLSQMCTRSVLAPQAFELHAAADRAGVALRGALKNLCDHRHPTRVAIAQVTGPNPEKSADFGTELGLAHEKTTLPPQSQGVTIPATIDPNKPALSEEHRPQVVGGQEDIVVK